MNAVWYDRRMADRLLEELRGRGDPTLAEALAELPDPQRWAEERIQSVAALRLGCDRALLASGVVRAVGCGVALPSLPAADIYLALACARGDDDAIRCFDAQLGPQLDRAIAKSPTLGLSAPEFRQLVYDRLFVAARGASLRIDKYAGQGSLKAWLRVIASRLVIDLSRRKDRSTASEPELVDRMGSGDDTELEVLRRAYGPALETAFAQALAGLSVRQRNLLRQRYLLEVNGDRLAKMYAVHRSTLFAWLDRARTDLLAGVRLALAQRVGADQLESVVGVLGSRLDLSIRRLLDSRLEAEAEPS